jgi:hypothetical protein
MFEVTFQFSHFPHFDSRVQFTFAPSLIPLQTSLKAVRVH